MNDNEAKLLLEIENLIGKPICPLVESFYESVGTEIRDGTKFIYDFIGYRSEEGHVKGLALEGLNLGENITLANRIFEIGLKFPKLENFSMAFNNLSENDIQSFPKYSEEDYDEDRLWISLNR